AIHAWLPPTSSFLETYPSDLLSGRTAGAQELDLRSRIGARDRRTVSKVREQSLHGGPLGRERGCGILRTQNKETGGVGRSPRPLRAEMIPSGDHSDSRHSYYRPEWEISKL